MFDDYLKTFICAAECGSFTKASELLFLSPNAVKKRINSIEESLGFPLFDRKRSKKLDKTFYLCKKSTKKRCRG